MPGKEKQLVDYLKKCREEIYNTNEFDYHWLKDDIKALYRDDRRIATVFTLFATISIFVSALGLFGLSLFDIRQRYREVAIRKVNGARLQESLFHPVPQIYMDYRRCNVTHDAIIILSDIHIYIRFCGQNSGKHFYLCDSFGGCRSYFRRHIVLASE